MKVSSLLILLTFFAFQSSSAQDRPLNPKPGACYAKCLIPDKSDESNSEEKWTEWREVVCGNNITKGLIKNIQNALREKGYDPGEENKSFNAETKAALKIFQEDNRLPVGQLDFETLDSLGIRY